MIRIIFGVFAFLAFGYLCGAFVQLNFDFRLWSLGGRLFTLLFSILGAFFVALVFAMESSGFESRKRAVIRGKAERV
jgi:mannose/fructose/N-acetylgalactosamine-specific phosphotransferase system component IIC